MDLANHDDVHDSKCRTLFIMARTSTKCLIFYAALVTLNIGMITWEFFGGEHQMIFLAAEGALTFCFATEVLLSMAFTPRPPVDGTSNSLCTKCTHFFSTGYFASWLNMFDFFVTILCVAFYCFFVAEQLSLSWAPAPGGMRMDSLDAFLLGCRYAFQVFRLCFFFFGCKKTMAAADMDPIDFDKVEAGLHRPRDSLTGSSGTRKYVTIDDEGDSSDQYLETDRLTHSDDTDELIEKISARHFVKPPPAEDSDASPLASRKVVRCISSPPTLTMPSPSTSISSSMSLTTSLSDSDSPSEETLMMSEGSSDSESVISVESRAFDAKCQSRPSLRSSSHIVRLIPPSPQAVY